VIFLVESTGASEDAYPDAPLVYDFDSAQSLTYDEFKDLGNFTARDLCIYEFDGTEISVLYVCDFEAEEDEVYGLGLYTGKAIKSVSKDAYYALIGGEVVIIDEDVYDTLEDKDAGLVAYKTTDGEIADNADWLLINNNNWGAWPGGDIDRYYDHWYGEDMLEYEICWGDVVSYDDGDDVLFLDNFHNGPLDSDLGGKTLYTDAFIDGWDYWNNDLVVLDDLEDGYYYADDGDDLPDRAQRAIVVFEDDGNNDLIYLLVWDIDMTT
jgi:hypothetical protein